MTSTCLLSPRDKKAPQTSRVSAVKCRKAEATALSNRMTPFTIKNSQLTPILPKTNSCKVSPVLLPTKLNLWQVSSIPIKSKEKVLIMIQYKKYPPSSSKTPNHKTKIQSNWAIASKCQTEIYGQVRMESMELINKIWKICSILQRKNNHKVSTNLTVL